MEPKLPTPESRPEQAPVFGGETLERPPVEMGVETGLERGHEQFEQRSEAAPAQATAAPVVLPTPVIAPLPQPDGAADGAIPGGNPVAAADDDLIEKEWVDRAKKIIQQTKDDPYRREQEISKLQADYLRKRYGKELGASE